MTRTFQVNTLFPGLTVLESVVLAVCERRGDAGIWHRTVASQGAAIDEALALLHTLGLEAEAGSPTRSLPYGRQRLLEIALALACKPRILLLDEPGAGISGPQKARSSSRSSRRCPGDVTILFIEHDMELVFRFAERITVLVRRAGAHGRHAFRDRGRPAGERGLPRGGPAWLSSSRSRE
jgi:branched-chain amino acid transport system ATP-binding protein